MYNYYPNYYQNYSTPTNDERIWVQNEVSADAYLVAPNGFVRLWDANKQRFYEKRADASGRPYPLEAYEYSKIDLRSDVNNASGGIVSVKELDAITRRIEALEEALNEQSITDDTGIQSVQTGNNSRTGKGKSTGASNTGKNLSESA